MSFFKTDHRGKKTYWLKICLFKSQCRESTAGLGVFSHNFRKEDAQEKAKVNYDKFLAPIKRLRDRRTVSFPAINNPVKRITIGISAEVKYAPTV
jgi:hypothetical protein